jgi:H+/Cl- antiporter ClcA
MNADQQFVLELAKWFTWNMFAIAAVVAIVGGIAFWKTRRGHAKTFSLLVRRAGVLHLLTVLAIIAAAVILAIIDKLESGSIAAILSGIAGYVLGGLAKTIGAPDEDGPSIQDEG